MFHSPQNERLRREPQSTDPEAGYVLLAVLFLVALILITLAVAAPKVAQSIQRDRELELVHRGEQYKRAIKLYYRKFGAYPSSIDQLMNTNQIRFLRKRYTDPMTGKDDWKIIHFGEAHVKTLGLFGQPISNGGNSTTAGSSVLGGTGPGGVGTTTGTGAGTTTPGGSLYAPSGSGTDGSQSGTGSTTSGASGFGSSGTSSTGFGSGTSGNTNPTLGGGPIVGFAIPSTKASIKEYKQQKHYNEWEFVYDPLADQLQGGTLFGGTGQNPNGTGTNGLGGNTSGTGVTSPSTGSGTPANPSPQQ